MKIILKKILALLLCTQFSYGTLLASDIEEAIYSSSAEGSGVLVVFPNNSNIDDKELIKWFRANWQLFLDELDKLDIAGDTSKRICPYAVIALAEELDDEEYLNFVERCVSDNKLHFFTAERMLDLIKGQNRRFSDIPSNYNDPRIQKIIAQAKTRFTGNKTWLEEIELIEHGETKRAMEEILDMNGLSAPRKFRNQNDWLLISAASILLVAVLLILTKKFRRPRLP